MKTITCEDCGLITDIETTSDTNPHHCPKCSWRLLDAYTGNPFETNDIKYLMNPSTGSVDTEENWLSELDSWEISQDGLTPQEQFDSLVEVVRGEDGGWIEAI